MAVVSLSNLLEAGVHFGHQTKRWNPKMKEYIFTTRDDIYIIDLQKTMLKIEEAYAEINNIAQNGGTFLFVGTKKQAQEAAKETAERAKAYFVTERWLGGTLTNFRTIRRRIKRLEDIEKMEADGVFAVLPKKEVIGLRKEYDKLNRVLCGIREMVKLPNAMIIVDPTKDHNAIAEARKLNIPVFGIIDTNCDPDDVDFVIPGNDDAVRSVKVVLGVLGNAICEANGLEVIDFVSDEVKKDSENKEIGNNAPLTAEVTSEKPAKAPVTEAATPEVETVQEEIATEVEAEEITTEAAEDLSTKTLSALKDMAKTAGIKGYSTMKKDQLISALSE